MIVIKLTEDHLKLLPFIAISNDNDKVIEIDKENMLLIHSSILDDVSLILGLRDKAIPKTENDADGRAFPDEVEHYMLSVYNYVKDNLYYIETIIHQFVADGGITAGTYKADERELFWTKF